MKTYIPTEHCWQHDLYATYLLADMATFTTPDPLVIAQTARAWIALPDESRFAEMRAARMAVNAAKRAVGLMVR